MCTNHNVGDKCVKRLAAMMRKPSFSIYLLLWFLYNTHSWASAGVNQEDFKRAKRDGGMFDGYHVRLAVMIMEDLLVDVDLCPW